MIVFNINMVANNKIKTNLLKLRFPYIAKNKYILFIFLFFSD